ncbi:MAG: hypothetical protein RL518_1055 [Pseudomonadota bacterium]|jgi:hypothetical protein
MRQQVNKSHALNSLRVPSPHEAAGPRSAEERAKDWVAPGALRAETPAGKITNCTLDTEIVRETCEFLRKRQPLLYRVLWDELQRCMPLRANPLLSTRKTRDEIPPLAPDGVSPHSESAHASPSSERRSTPYTLSFPTIGKGHWAYSKHRHVGNYERPRSEAEAQAGARLEGKLDIKSITRYLKSYEKLSRDVSGKNLWKATRHAASDRGPYDTTMTIVQQTANPPEHFYALIHYGMGLHMLYEQSLHRKPDTAPAPMAKVTGILRECFKAIARMYREDFCQVR